MYVPTTPVTRPKPVVPQILVIRHNRQDFESEMIPYLEKGYTVVHLSVAGAGTSHSSSFAYAAILNPPKG